MFFFVRMCIHIFQVLVQWKAQCFQIAVKLELRCHVMYLLHDDK